MELLKQEYKKIFKSWVPMLVFILFVIGFIMVFMYWFDFNKTVQSTVDYNLYAEQFEGPLDMEFVQECEDFYFNYQQIYSKYKLDPNTLKEKYIELELKNKYYISYLTSEMWLSFDNETTIDNMSVTARKKIVAEMQANGMENSREFKNAQKSIENLDALGQPAYFYNVNGAKCIFFGTLGIPNILFVFCFIIVVICSSSFSGEYRKNMNSIISTSKLGWNHIIVIKCFVSISLVFLCATLFYMIFSLGTLCMFDNFSSLNKPIQALGDLLSWCPYNITIKEALVQGYFSFISGSLAISAMLCMISACFKNILSSAVASVIFMYLPLVFNRLYLHPSFTMIPYNLFQRYNSFYPFGYILSQRTMVYLINGVIFAVALIFCRLVYFATRKVNVT